MQRVAAGVVISVLLLALFFPSANAANQVVTSNSDSGAGSLRQAIADVGVGEEITFDDDYTITLTSTLTVGKSMTITGTGAGQTVIDGDNSVLCFDVTGGIVDVTISDLTIQNGSGSSCGGIESEETLTLNDCTIQNNSCTWWGAAGINILGGSITMNNCTISGNSNTGNPILGAGGLRTLATATVTNCTFSGNSTVSTNGNSAGGFFCQNVGATITNCTFSNNTAVSGGGGYDGSNGSLTIANCFLGGNSSTSGDGDDIDAGIIDTITNNGYNLVEVSDGYTFNATGDITGQQANLFGTGKTTQTLAANGTGNGTWTLALEAGSVAIDQIPQSAGSNDYNGCPGVDQRIHTRPTGTGTTNNRDLGSYEYNAPLMVELVSFTASKGKEEVRLRWDTASEFHNAGFHVWRSESRDGVYTRITDELIPAVGSPLWGATYEWTDTGAEPGLAHHYQLEDIDYDGTHRFHGPTPGWAGLLNIKQKQAHIRTQP
jgi:hypothetical protein